jgi:hypothetical protein
VDPEKTLKLNVKTCHQQLHFMIKAITDALVRFYSIELKHVVGTQDVRKDLL